MKFFRVGIFLLLASVSFSASAFWLGHHKHGFSQSGLVTNGNDSGPGSFRQAIESGARTVVIKKHVSTIRLESPVNSFADGPLTIIGSGQIIDATQVDSALDILVLAANADLTISNLTLVGPNNEVNQDSLNFGGRGILVATPLSAKGVIKITMNNVTVTKVAYHGVHVTDCGFNGIGCDTDFAPDIASSSVYFKATNLTVTNTGFGRPDADGVRIDESGKGDIYFSAFNSKFIRSGGDGIQLSEAQDGNIVVNVQNSLFDSNGEYCSLVTDFVGTLCDHNGAADLGDGFNIKEDGVGNIFPSVSQSKVMNNFGEGFDFSESGSDGIQAAFYNVLAIDNANEGIKISENDNGKLSAYLYQIELAANNADKEGITLVENDDGSVYVKVIGSGSAGGDKESVKVQQLGGGNGTLKVYDSDIEFDLEGVTRY